jgi:hypothetical protein
MKKIPKTKKCPFCGKLIKKQQKFCSQVCARDYKHAHPIDKNPFLTELTRKQQYMNNYPTEVKL